MNFSFVANPTATPSVTTTYTLTVTESSGCTASDAITITVNDLPSADAGADITIVGGASTTIGGNPTAGGGTPGYTYSWSPSSTLSSNVIANPVATPNNTTTYTVTVTDNEGCSANDAVTVSIAIPLSAEAGPNLSLIHI